MTQLWSGISFAKNCFFGLIGGGPRVLVATIAATALMGSPCVFGQTLTTLYNFGSHAHDGADPQAGVVFDETGNLYGATAIGGKAGSNGILFELKPTSLGLWSEIVLHKFQGRPDGKIPEGRVIFGSMGTLVGTTSRGGVNDMGTVFAWSPSPDGSRSEKVLYSFGSIPNDAVQPTVGLIAAPSGFYGAAQGGANNTGAVYNLSPPIAGKRTWTETILYSFKGSGSGDAAFPSGELVSDASGNLYGATLLGGVNNLGAVFQLSPPAVQGDPWTETIIYSFSGTDGTLPAGPLLLDTSGALYGTTDGGGTKAGGTVFKLAPPRAPGGSWTETVLFNFSGGSLDGGNPSAGVIMNKKGRLLGTASTGGQGAGGVVFMLKAPGGNGEWSETVLHSFSGPDGYRPISPLVLRRGEIYGTTSLGGLFGTGTVFVLRR